MSPLPLKGALYRADANRLRTFPAFAGFVLNAFIILKRLGVRLDIRAMDEQVSSSFIRYDKPKAFLIVEPLHSTSRQLRSPRRSHVFTTVIPRHYPPVYHGHYRKEPAGDSYRALSVLTVMIAISQFVINHFSVYFSVLPIQ